MNPSQELFEEGFDCDMIVESTPLEFDVDATLNRSRNPNIADLMKRLFKFMTSISLACKHMENMIEDIKRMNAKWSLKEAHLFLHAVSWHIERPFFQTLFMIKTTILDKSDLIGSRRTFRGYPLPPGFTQTFDDAVRQTSLLGIQLMLASELARSSGFSPLRLPENEVFPCKAPALSPRELFAEILRRCSYAAIASYATPEHLLRKSSR